MLNKHPFLGVFLIFLGFKFLSIKRFMEDKALTKPLSRLVYTNLKTARTNSVSIQSVASRFKELLGKLPVPSAEIMRQAQELRDFDEARRMPYVVSGSPD
ncbi:hypothetical protein JFX91_27720 [Escherichia coli]|uniref:hypothetical protein n=1 Tax=Escherichia coli TaxID=562 RepID=UPI0018E86FB3|nr:hypothetical protein [Escherichia coli]MBJ2018284.1 hypothetical protein [Escherichia coli]